MAIETADENEREEAQSVADGLMMYLAVDWSAVEDVEVRYHDGSTEVPRIRDDDADQERLRLASAFRAIEPLDYSSGRSEAGMIATWQLPSSTT